MSDEYYAGRHVSVWKDGVELGGELMTFVDKGVMVVRYPHMMGRRDVTEYVKLGEEGMIHAPNGHRHGEVRRAKEGFAHAVLLDQGTNERCWLIVDVYGPMETVDDAEVKDWPVVYVPEHDARWRERHEGA